MALSVKAYLADPEGDSYITVAFADDYHEKRGNTLWDTMTTAEKEASCIRATDYIIQAYGNRWKTEYLEDEDSVPAEVEKATAEMAFKAAQGEVNADLTRGVVRGKVDVIEVEYDPRSPQAVRYRSIDQILAGLVSGSVMNAKVVRV